MDVLVRLVLVAEVDRRLGPKKPFPQRSSSPGSNLEKERGARVYRGLTFGFNRSESSRPLWRATRSKLLAAKLRVAGRAGGDTEPITGS